MKHNIGVSEDGDRNPGETNDCTVRCLSFAFSVPYKKAHAFLKEKGRKNKKGVPFFTVIGHGGTIFEKKFYYHKRPGLTVKNFLLAHPKGIFMVGVRKHVFAVKNGVIHDSFKQNPNIFITDFCFIGDKDFIQKDYDLNYCASKRECVEVLYNIGYQPSVISDIMKKEGWKTTEGSVRCFIRSINQEELNEEED